MMPTPPQPPTNPQRALSSASGSQEAEAEPERRCESSETASEILLRIRTERRERWEAEQLAKYEAKGKQPPKNWQDKYKEPEPVDESELPELPRGWCWASLPQISWDESYGTSTKCDYKAAGHPVLRIPNVARGLISLEDMKRSLKPLEESPEEFLAVDDFVIVRTNGSRDLIGRAAAVIDELPEPTFFASYLIRYRILGGNHIAQWISTIWASPQIRDVIERLAATSAGQYNVSLSKLSTVPVPIPPEAEVRHLLELVAEALELVDSVSAGRASMESSLTQLDQSILSKAFRGELVPQDPRDEPASELLARIRTTREKLEEEKLAAKAAKKKSTKRSSKKKTARKGK